MAWPAAGTAVASYTFAESLTVSLVGGLVSSAVGYVASSLFAPDGPDMQGSRLGDLSAPNNSYGAALPKVYGKMVVPGNLIWLENDQIKETKHKEDVGGKGGPPGGTITTYTYSMTGSIAISEGPIDAVGKVWADTILIHAAINDDSGLTDAQHLNLQFGGAHYNFSTDLADFGLDTIEA